MCKRVIYDGRSGRDILCYTQVLADLANPNYDPQDAVEILVDEFQRAFMGSKD